MKYFACLLFTLFSISKFDAQETLLLRSPDINGENIAYKHGGDIWVSNINSNSATRITSTPAVESNPHISPDGKWVAFNSTRSGSTAVYIAPIDGGSPTRLTWHPSAAFVKGWSRDGNNIIYTTARESAPTGYNRLWSVSKNGGPSAKLNEQWIDDASYSPDGKKVAIQRVSKWDPEWRAYRGGQNTPLIILDLMSNEEILLPHDNTIDIHPTWIGDHIYFLSDRDLTSNIWSYNITTKELTQVTKFKGTDTKWLSGKDNTLCFEREGKLHLMDIPSKEIKTLSFQLKGDFPWSEPKWEDVSGSAGSASLSPNAKRAIMQSRGEIFTVPVENGSARNISKSSDAADRAPIWSPKGNQIAWFSDEGMKNYQLVMADQEGVIERKIDILPSKLGWDPVWSPDGKHIAFVDDDVRVRIVDLETDKVKTIDNGGNNLERGNMGLSWSPDSKWLAYAKSGDNNFRQIWVWSSEDGSLNALTNNFADAFSPTWDLDKKHFYFLASTDLALGSGWANTSAMTSRPEYAAYIVNLQIGEESPFSPKSDEEEIKNEEEEIDENEDEEKDKDEEKEDEDEDRKDEEKEEALHIDFENIERRTMALPIDVANYRYMVTGPEGHVFIGESKPDSRGITIHKYSIEDREAKEFLSGAGQASVSYDGKNMLARVNGNWSVIATNGPSGKDGKALKVNLQMKLDRSKEWTQIFEEAWRYEKDYFYDPNIHGRDWDVVHKRYAPLVPHVKHRTDLSYILDQVNGELSVGHSFVFGGDFPDTESNKVGLLGADFKAENGRWKITRIYTTESWNPELTSPLDRPDLDVQIGDYLVGIDGQELTDKIDPYLLLDGTLDKQTKIHLNSKPKYEGARIEIVKPIRSEYGLRQRAWVEDNRRMVDKLSDGKLAYIWVPNTGGPGFVSFNRYLFAQQDKKGAVIDERFNGGGLLDDYMVDLATRKLRAAITNEVPNGKPFKLPAGILGPKVLLINEMAGSGGDFFPWVFRQQKAGPLIGKRTWGGLVKSSVHYGLVDGGALTSPDNAVFDPVNNKWIAENIGVAPDIEVRQDAKALAEGRDPQLERAVEECLKMLQSMEQIDVTPPPFSKPAKGQ